MTKRDVPANLGTAEYAALRADLAQTLPLADGLAAILGSSAGLPPTETGRAAHAALVADLTENLGLSSGIEDILSTESDHHALLADLPGHIDLAGGLARILGPASPVPSGSRDAGSGMTDATASAMWPTGTLSDDTENNLAKLAAVPGPHRLLLRLNHRYRQVRTAIDVLNDIRHALAQPAGRVRTDAPTDSVLTSLLRHHEALTRLIADLAAAPPDVPGTVVPGTVGQVIDVARDIRVREIRVVADDLEQRDESADPQGTDSDSSEGVWVQRTFQGPVTPNPGDETRWTMVEQEPGSAEAELAEVKARRAQVRERHAQLRKQLAQLREQLPPLAEPTEHAEWEAAAAEAEEVRAMYLVKQQVEELEKQLARLKERDAPAEDFWQETLNEIDSGLRRHRFHGADDPLLAQSDNVLRELVDDLVDLHDSGLIDQQGAAHRQACREGAAQLALVLDQVAEALTSFHGADLRDAEIRPEDAEDLDGIRWCDQTADEAATRWPPGWESKIRQHSVEVPWSPGSFVIRWGVPMRSAGG